MLVCDRCGESYRKGAKDATEDHCGTCNFINGPPPETKKVVTFSTPRAPERHWDSPDTPLV